MQYLLLIYSAEAEESAMQPADIQAMAGLPSPLSSRKARSAYPGPPEAQWASAVAGAGACRGPG